MWQLNYLDIVGKGPLKDPESYALSQNVNETAAFLH